MKSERKQARVAGKIQKRLGKKHRQASTRPKKGKSPRAANTGAGRVSEASPKGRKKIATKKRAAIEKARTPRRSPEFERKETIIPDVPLPKRERYVAPPEKIRIGDRPATQVELGGSLIEEAQHPASEPLIAICGRPNVGKSTLFNRLTGTRRSIVGDEPGITRDRIYGEVEWQGRKVRLVDTGGVIPDDEALIPSEIFRQAQVALNEAEAIVMVVDGRSEITAPDVEMARLLVRSGKPIFLAVNKMESTAVAMEADNFRTLGFKEVFAISAEHGTGVGDLLDAVYDVLPASEAATEAEEEAADDEITNEDEPKLHRTHGEFDLHETKIAIIGRPNVGKSTLLNALTGTKRAIVSPIAGTTRDAVDEVVTRGGHDFRFVDTAGIRRKGKTTAMAEKLSVIMARKHLEASDVALLVIDATEGVTALDANIGGYAHESGRSVVIVVNKWDAVTSNREDKTQPGANQKVYTEQVREHLKYLDYAPLVFISAQKSMNVPAVFREVARVAKERRKRVTTGEMNRFLKRVDFQRASVPMSRRVKIYFMTQAAVAPPTFVLFTDKDVKLHFSFERFLENQIRESFGFVGTPIWFKTKGRNKKVEE
ncbi:ribosome biogenesis GTPase Der [Terriglobus albidus]|uniref:ribosome biogenesis GTPase Der n=1 Tax=Terriglobus albidus TaxID=1592106 RepID=UPI0021DF989C|nr:ribosome biogenesis GTPase Der [Terriglobus albidus]